MIKFEKISEEQKSMLDFLKNFGANLSKKYNQEYLLKTVKNKEIPMELLSEVANKALSAGIAQYLGMFIAGEGAFPIKLNTLRLVVVEMADELSGTNLIDLMSAFRTVQLLSTSMGLAAIAAGHGMDEVMNKYVPQVLAGNFISWAITEPDAGTNTHKITTTAVNEGDYYRLNGQKVFITDAKESKYMVLVAKVISDGEYKGIHNIVIDSGSKGVSMTPMDIALTGDTQYNVYFDNVMVPKENLLIRELKGKDERKDKEKEISVGTFSSLNLERIWIAMFGVALGRIIVNKAVEYAKQQKIFESPIGAYQGVKQSLAEVKIKVELANLANQRAAEAYDNREDPEVVGAYANMAKLVGGEVIDEALKVALQIYGSYGFLKENELVALLPTGRLLRVAPINNEMVLNYLGEHILGLPKSYR